MLGDILLLLDGVKRGDIRQENKDKIGRYIGTVVENQKFSMN